MHTGFSAQIHAREQQVPKLVLEPFVIVRSGQFFGDLAELLRDFGDRSRCIRPVKTDAGRPILQAVRAVQRGQRQWETVTE